MSSKHDPRANVLLLCSISRLSILCHFEGEEVYSLVDSDILTLVYASPASDGPRKNGVQTKHLRQTSLQSLDWPPVSMDLIRFIVKSLLLVGVLMCTFQLKNVLE